MNFLKKLIAPVFKAEVKGLHYAHNVAMFFGFLPLIDSETSGRPRGPLLEKWKKGFEKAEKGFAHLQIGQMRLLAKIGLLDAEFIGKEAESYLHDLDIHEYMYVEKSIERVIAMNMEGSLTDVQAAHFLDEVAQAHDLSFRYHPETEDFHILADAPDAALDNLQQACWDRLTDWALNKADMLPQMDEATQKKMAVALTRVFQDIPIRDSESNSVVLGARSEDNNLCVIFKNAVNAKGEPLAATENHADFGPAMIDWLENDPDYAALKDYLTKRGYPDDERIRERNGFVTFLRGHGDKKQRGPSA